MAYFRLKTKGKYPNIRSPLSQRCVTLRRSAHKVQQPLCCSLSDYQSPQLITHLILIIPQDTNGTLFQPIWGSCLLQHEWKSPTHIRLPAPVLHQLHIAIPGLWAYGMGTQVSSRMCMGIARKALPGPRSPWGAGPHPLCAAGAMPILWLTAQQSWGVLQAPRALLSQAKVADCMQPTR